jgi:hypothetical protein
MFCDDGFLELFGVALQRLSANYDLRPPLLDPAVGAALYAAKRSGHPLSPRATHHLITAESKKS